MLSGASWYNLKLIPVLRGQGETKERDRLLQDDRWQVFPYLFVCFKTSINGCLLFVDIFIFKNQVVNIYYKLKMSFLKIST